MNTGLCKTDMATLDSLKLALKRKAAATTSCPTQSLSDSQYSAGFNILLQGPGWMTYQDFIIPQLSQLLVHLLSWRTDISVLEIGPGPKSVLGHLPGSLRQKIRRYAAYEPSALFATKLEEWFAAPSETGLPLPCLESPREVHRLAFTFDSKTESSTSASKSDGDDKFDIILFCHSMYGMRPKNRFIEHALDMLAEKPEGGVVVVFHRDGDLQIDGLVCHKTASFPTGVVQVADEDDALDSFAAFIAGFTIQDEGADRSTRLEWREICRALGHRDEAHPDCLLFSCPDVMITFTQHATALPELASQVPLLEEKKAIKNREARLHSPTAIARPKDIQQVQHCVQWARRRRTGLTIIGGSHSGHCLWRNVVAVDMGAFDKVDILEANSDSLVVAGAGCTTGDIIHKTVAAGLTVPLGSRPSVGAGLWLQGGIGHLARLHGLACDAIVGAVMVSVDSGHVLCVGRVPSQYQPAGAVRPANETDLLWALKGAGTNFGIVVSVTFKACAAPIFSVRNWVLPLKNSLEAQTKLGDFGRFAAGRLPREWSADAYLYWDANQLHLGVTTYQSTDARSTSEPDSLTSIQTILGPERTVEVVNAVGLFETEMYMSGMHGGHAGGKTSSFKRCIFLKNIIETNIVAVLVAAVESRPSPLCYLHLLHGGGAVSDVAADASAFGCRDWDFACVVTGVWPRDKDETEVARAAVGWVYNVARRLLPLSGGVYGADLGPDPRDAALAVRAFGPNPPRLARLKRRFDPCNILAYACPLPNTPIKQKLIVLVTGESGVGKDYCANIWESIIIKCPEKCLGARVVSISDATKREYAFATGTDLDRLYWDRAYKEKHRPALTSYFQNQVRQRPRLPEEHFLNLVYGNVDVDVLFITGMRDEAPVASFSHLVSECRMLDVHIKASKRTCQTRRGCHGDDDLRDSNTDNNKPGLELLDYHPSLVLDNDIDGDATVRSFAEVHLLPFFHEDLERLAHMVRGVPDFPRPGIEFRHVLGIAQKPGGLSLCTSLLQAHFTGDWAKVDMVACCETSGYVFASALAARIGVPLALIREAGKLPPPTISAIKSSSHISTSESGHSKEGKIEIGQGAIPRGASVVVVDDVLATGRTLSAVLRLLKEPAIGAGNVGVMVVAEFPVHRGRELLRQHGFGQVGIQSLLVFGGA
ncbi:phosphoribosyl transferase domain protein [Astrocystis sublimbata]|nr:phosphoribosyl transferase domain protein [Astrocystis sublimbata]